MGINENDFNTITAEESWDKYGWGVDLKPESTVYRREVGDTVIWIGELDEQPERWVCEVEVSYELMGQKLGVSACDAMLNALVISVVSRSVREEWDEPIADGLKCSRDDVIDAMAQYAYVLYTYGYDKLDEMFPNGSEGRPIEGAEVELYEDLRIAADDMLGERL